MDFPFVFPNYEHQQREFELNKDKRARALLWRMRTGKTKAMVDLACYLWTRGRIDAVLVVAPNGVHLNWVRREVPRHSWPIVPYKTLAWDSHVVKRRWFRDHLLEVLNDSGDFRLPWLAVNSEGLLSDGSPDISMMNLLRKMLLQRRVLLIVDESDDFARPGSKRTIRMRAISKYAAFVRILTGTVIANTPLAAYSQFQLLEKGALGYDTFEEFEEHFAVYAERRGRGGRSFKTLDSYANLDELTEAMARWSSVVLRSDVKGLSAIVPGVSAFRMTDRQAKAYELMLDGMIDDIEADEPINPEDWAEVEEPFAGGAKLVKLQQIASGFVRKRDGTVIDLCGGWKKNPRIKAMLEQVHKEDGKVIVWCRFKEDIRNVVAALSAQRGRKVVEFHGGISNRQKEKNLAAFQDDPDVTDMVGQPQSLGRGRDLSQANQMIWYSHIYSNVLREQASERATAVGKEPVAMTDLSAIGTVDEGVLENIEKKQETSELVAGEGLRLFLEQLQQRWLSKDGS